MKYWPSTDLTERLCLRAKQIMHHGVDFLYPPHCWICQRDLIQAGDSGGEVDFCRDCRNDLLRDAGDACLRCGSPVGPYVDASQGCSDCQRTKFAFDQVIRVGLYRHQLRKACLIAKGGRTGGFATGLSRLHWSLNWSLLQSLDIEMVIPVPQYWLQRFSRLHNPAESLAIGLAKNLKASCKRHILAKARWTRPQRSLSATRRRENVRNAFRVKRSWQVEGATVLLVDDIMTTGATVHEVARTLKRAGAKRVVVAVIAKAAKTMEPVSNPGLPAETHE